MDSAQVLIALAFALAVVAFVVWPLLERRPAAGGAGQVDLERVERRILEYREALRRRTVCASCLYANPARSRFCGQCGSRLATADA